MTELSISRAALDPAAASRPALIAAGAAFSFAELADQAARARASLAREGVTAGSRVALLAGNGVATVVAILALLDLGATLVPIHPRLTPSEAAVLLADAAPALTLREADLAGLLDAAPAPAPAPVSAELPLALLYTSGTSGRPKGAILARRAFLAAAAASEANLGWTAGDRWLLAMPLCHVGGLSIVTRCLAARRAVILEARFEARAALATIVRDRATLLSVVPTMLQALLEHDADGALAGLRAVLLGGAAAPFTLVEECARRGVPALTTYGLTEACSQVTVQRLSSPHRARRGSGEPLPGVELEVARLDGGAAPPGEVGRLRVRGATLMDGYFRGEGAAPDRARDAEGWFDTGDLGVIDGEGVLHVHARRSDLIVTGGENVYPVEVEQRLEALPGVRRALVFGVADARWGQVVAAAMEMDAGCPVEALAPRVAEVLAPHKRPRLVCQVEALPLTSSGKLVRGGAAERYAEVLRPLECRRG